MPAFASKTDDAIAAFTGGASVTEGGIDLTAPEIAENGNTVPVSVSAPGAVSIMLLATGNPTPAVATFNFGPMAGTRSGATRIRLAKDPRRGCCRENGRRLIPHGGCNCKSNNRRLRRLNSEFKEKY
jgi:predicted secreted protein